MTLFLNVCSEFDNLEASSPAIPEMFQKMYMNLLAKDGNTMTHSSLFEKIKIKTEDSNPTSSSQTDPDVNSSSSDDLIIEDAYDWGNETSRSTVVKDIGKNF